MGKDLRGKELGRGISQREDGLYVARYTNKYGKRVQKVLPKLQELRQWLADAQYKEEHSNIDFPDAMTVNALFNMLDYAYQNDVILKNPCNKMVKSEIGKQSRKKQALTLGQQKEFCKVAIGNTYEYQYRFLLQTGLRTGEMVGLRWSDVDLEKRLLTINRSMEYRHSTGEWRIGEPKTLQTILGHSNIGITMNLYVLPQKSKNIKKLTLLRMH